MLWALSLFRTYVVLKHESDIYWLRNLRVGQELNFCCGKDILENNYNPYKYKPLNFEKIWLEVKIWLKKLGHFFPKTFYPIFYLKNF